MIREKYVVKLRLDFFITLVMLVGSIQAQQLRLPLSHAGTQDYRNAVFVFGLSAHHSKPTLLVYKCDSTLKITDSIQISLGKKPISDYSNILSDTLHGVLHLYLHGNHGIGGTIVRPSSNLSTFELIPNIDSPRMNQMAKFSAKKKLGNACIYDVSRTLDSSGQQYYISKFKRLSAEGNYDYKREWQFPLDKKDIDDVLIAHENEKHIFIYVYRTTSSGATQWLLRLSAATGQLQKASRVASNGNDFLRFATAIQDKRSQEVYLMGQTIKPTVDAATKNTCGLWLASIDTSGKIEQVKIQRYVQEAAVKNSKTKADYFLNLQDIKKMDANNFEITIDLYESTGPACKRYAGSQKLRFDARAESSEQSAQILKAPTEISSYFTSADKLDRNAKICVEGQESFDRMGTMHIETGGIKSVRYGTSGPDHFLLHKVNLKKNCSTLDLFTFEKGHYTLSTLSNSFLSEAAQYLVITPLRVIAAIQESPEIYRINLFYW